MLNVEEGNTDFGWFPDINIHDGALEKKPSAYTFGCVNRPLRLFAKSTLKRVTTAKVTWTFAINSLAAGSPLGAGAFVTQGGDGPAYKNGGGQSVGQLAHDLDGTTAITEIVVLANVGVVFDENTPLKLWKYDPNNVLPEQRSQVSQEIPASDIPSVPILAFVEAVPLGHFPSSAASYSTAYRLFALNATIRAELGPNSTASGEVVPIRGQTIRTGHTACVGTNNVQSSQFDGTGTEASMSYKVSFTSIQKSLAYFTTAHKDLCVEDQAQTSTPGDKWCSQQDVVASFDNVYVDTPGDRLFRVVPNVARPSLQMPVFSVFCDTAVSDRSFSFSICGQTIALNATTVSRRTDEAEPYDGVASLERMLEEACPSIIPDAIVIVTGNTTTTCNILILLHVILMRLLLLIQLLIQLLHVIC